MLRHQIKCSLQSNCFDKSWGLRCDGLQTSWRAEKCGMMTVVEPPSIEELVQLDLGIYTMSLNAL